MLNSCIEVKDGIREDFHTIIYGCSCKVLNCKGIKMCFFSRFSGLVDAHSTHGKGSTNKGVREE